MGAPPWVFRRIIVPLALPGISVAAVFSAIMSWNGSLRPGAVKYGSGQDGSGEHCGNRTSYQIAWGEMTALAQ